MDFKTAVVNKPSVFESLKFYCTFRYGESTIFFFSPSFFNRGYATLKRKNVLI